MRKPTSRLAMGVLSALPLALVLWGCATRGPDPELERDRRRAQSHRELGVDHLSNGRPELALRELLLSDRLDPLQPDTHFALANAYLYKGRRKEAEDQLLRALEVHPEFHDARLNLSTLYLEQRRWSEALEQASILLDDPTFPGPWRALSNQGWAQLNLGMTAEARRSLEMARDYSPGYWPALLNLGILEQQAGHHLEALELYQQMLELGPDPNAEAEANYRAAEIYVSLGHRDRAVGHLMSAVARSPEGEWGKKSEEYLRLLR